MKLLIDIGNTRLKWVCYQAQRRYQTEAMMHAQEETIYPLLMAAWQGMHTPSKIYLAAVGAKVVKLAVIAVATQLWPDVPLKEVLTQGYAKGVTNAYAKPEKLGIDRWLALLAAYHYYTGPLCVVDCGTAITLDVLDQQGHHLGGMIMPGLTMLQNSLQQGTAATLNVGTQKYKLGLANNTEAAIFSGNLYAIKGFVEFGLAQIKQPLCLLMTGGDAEFIVDTLELGAIVDTQLVFKGLALLSDE